MTYKLIDSINRNIVECKGIVCRSVIEMNKVLIETSWNVKENLGTKNPKSVAVLIEHRGM